MPRNSSTVPAAVPRTAPSPVVTAGAGTVRGAAARARAAVAPAAVRVSAAPSVQGKVSSHGRPPGTQVAPVATTGRHAGAGPGAPGGAPDPQQGQGLSLG